MKNRWKIGKVRKRNGEFYIEVKNTSPHAHLVEDGHAVRNRPDGPILGFAKGRKILQISVSELEQELPDYLQNWLGQMLRELEL
jgi:hypothetical protein